MYTFVTCASHIATYTYMYVCTNVYNGYIYVCMYKCIRCSMRYVCTFAHCYMTYVYTFVHTYIYVKCFICSHPQISGSWYSPCMRAFSIWYTYKYTHTYESTYIHRSTGLRLSILAVYARISIWSSCVYNTLQHTATHCNTLQHTATHCNTLQHTATHCNTLHLTRQYAYHRHRISIWYICIDTHNISISIYTHIHINLRIYTHINRSRAIDIGRGCARFHMIYMHLHT